MEIFQDKIGSTNQKSRLSQISEALDDLFSGNDINSEMKDSVKNVYELLDVITNKLPHDLKTELLLGPTHWTMIQPFMNDIRIEYANLIKELREKYENMQEGGDAFDIDRFLKMYQELFEKGGEGYFEGWNKIKGNYNPGRLEQVLK